MPLAAVYLTDLDEQGFGTIWAWRVGTDAPIKLGEHGDLGCHHRFHDEALGVVHDLGEGGRLVGEPPVQLVQGPGLRAVDEDSVEQIQCLVAGRARDVPRRGPSFAWGQDLLRHHVHGPTQLL